jgi:hypothetical protein
MSARFGRTRPRARSFGFFNLSWVLIREAALRVMLPYEELPQPLDNLRRQLCEQDTHHIRRDALRLIAREHWRRIYPQPTLFPLHTLGLAEHLERHPATAEPPPTA